MVIIASVENLCSGGQMGELVLQVHPPPPVHSHNKLPLTKKKTESQETKKFTDTVYEGQPPRTQSWMKKGEEWSGWVNRRN